MATMKAVALLHDVIEDCGVTYDELVSSFGLQVAFGVLQLSDILQVGNRASRKEQTRMRLKNSPDWVQTIKCADIINNCPSIMKHDSKFAETYIPECKALLDVMDKADEYLLGVAFNVISGTAGKDVS